MSLPNFRGFARLTVYVVECYEGAGTTDDPGRLVSTYFAEDGRELWRDDPCPGDAVVDVAQRIVRRGAVAGEIGNLKAALRARGIA